MVPIIFLWSGNIVFRQKHDLSAYCMTEHGNHHGAKPIYLKSGSSQEQATDLGALKSALDMDDDLVLLLATI